MSDATYVNILLNSMKPIKEPYTESTKEYYIKPILVYCESCNYTITTSLVYPKCGDCNRNLIVVVKSLITDDIVAR